MSTASNAPEILAAGGTIYALIKKNMAGLLAGIIACSAVTGIGYRAVILPHQSWMLATGASLSALKELCALPEGTSAWKDSGCEGRAPKLIRAISFAVPSLVFELGNKIILLPESTTEIPTISEDNRPAWLINIAEEPGRKALDEVIDAAVAQFAEWMTMSGAPQRLSINLSPRQFQRHAVERDVLAAL